ncbi:hypothetical protein PG991_006618 [Apiospora marii]|uniref:Hydrophobin n=1 Tax=Apiospora marii TaxID=335849 RepID=A0ABR1RZM7_9PEZI
MQFTIISTLFLATAAIASPVAAPPPMEPADLVVRTGGGGGGGDSKTCSGDTKQVCCNGLLNCVVQVLGSQCSGGGGLININALNCVKLL